MLLVYVIPQFQSFYEGLDAELPLPTRILLATVAGSCAPTSLWIVLGVAVAVARSSVLAPARGLGRRPRRARCCACPTSAG